jgi:glyoxylase-like metal-dependent hydrolase (beta-lactamase superfamily II)
MRTIELELQGLKAWLLDCGTFRHDGGVIFGPVPKQEWSKYCQADEANRILLAIRPLLVASESGYVLVNAGWAGPEGQGSAPGTRPISAALGELGLEPESIAVVILTHLHPDHIGGLFLGSGTARRPFFARARHLVQRAEAAAAAYPNERTRADYDPGALRCLEEAGLLTLLPGSCRVDRHVRALLCPGHTPGHQCVRLESGMHSALYPSDLAALPVQAERLAWVQGLDLEPLRTLESKRSILGQAVEEGSYLLFEHEPDDERAVGRLVPSGKRWRFQPERPS